MTKATEIRIRLEEADFQRLVNGGEVVRVGPGGEAVRIVLAEADREPLRRLLWERIFASAEELSSATDRHGSFLRALAPQLLLEKWITSNNTSWHPRSGSTWGDVVEACHERALLSLDEAMFLLELPSTALMRWWDQLGPFVGVEG